MAPIQLRQYRHAKGAGETGGLTATVARVPRWGYPSEPIDWAASGPGPDRRRSRRLVGAVLVGIGPLLILLALGLAFTIYGDVSALLGMASLGAGITILSRS